MLPILVFAGSLICLGNLLGLFLFVLAYRRQSARQRELLHRTRDDFQEAINQILDRYQALRASIDGEGDRDVEGEVDGEFAGEFDGDADRQIEGAEPRTPEFATIASTVAGSASMEGQAAALTRAAVAGAGMTFSKRAQILRLHRQGESAASIAASVGVPRPEIELIVKLHRAAELNFLTNSSQS